MARIVEAGPGPARKHRATLRVQSGLAWPPAGWPAAVRRALRAAAWLLPVVPMLGGCAWLDRKQRELALRPSPGRPAAFAAFDAGLRPGDQRTLVPMPPAPDADGSAPAPTAPQQLALWWLPHPDPAAPTLLYLHGTFRSLYANLPKIDALRALGFAVLAVDYRGWGDSTPIVPSEASIDADAQRAWDEMTRRQPDPARRVIFGHSMGGAVAVSLASRLRFRTDYGALALEATFTRLPDVAAEAGGWGRLGAALTTLRFDSMARIGRVDAPLLMLHGRGDGTVPIALGRRLRDAARAPVVDWVEIAGGTHSRLHDEAPAAYRDAFARLVARLPPAAAFAGPPAAAVAPGVLGDGPSPATAAATAPAGP